MALRLPFKKWNYDEASCYKDEYGGYYYFIPTHGKRVIAAISLRTIAGGFTYRIHTSFRRKYTNALNLVEPFTWTNRDHFRAWLNAQVHNSFVHSSTPGVQRCWFYKCLSAEEIRRPMIVPVGYRPYLSSTQAPVWILLRLGAKAWPIQVNDDRFEKGWQKFRKAHTLKVNQRIIFSSEHQWIFNVTILDEEEKERMYTWSFQMNPLWQNPHVPNGNLITACLPSTIHMEHPLLITAFVNSPDTNLYEEFQEMLHPFLIEPPETSLLITMANRNWVILFNDDLTMDRPLFDDYMATLKLRPYDYLFVTLLPAFRLKVVVLDWIGSCERIYSWFTLNH